MTMSLRRVVLVLALVCSLNSSAYMIDHLKFQYAGEIGTYAIGLGKQFSENYSLDLFHGRVPQSVGGVEIDTYALKSNFSLFRHVLDPVIFYTYYGVNVYHVTGLDYQASRHSSYPDSYYRVGSIRALLFIGEKVRFGEELKNEVYFESGLNDVVIINYLNNSDVINPFDFVSLALGYTYIF